MTPRLWSPRFRRYHWADNSFRTESRFHFGSSDGRSRVHRRVGEHFHEGCVEQQLFGRVVLIVCGGIPAIKERTFLVCINGIWPTWEDTGLLDFSMVTYPRGQCHPICAGTTRYTNLQYNSSVAGFRQFDSLHVSRALTSPIWRRQTRCFPSEWVKPDRDLHYNLLNHIVMFRLVGGFPSIDMTCPIKKPVQTNNYFGPSSVRSWQITLCH